MILQSKTFDEALEENLLLYISNAPEYNLFQTHREISLARYALSQQAIAYAKAIEILSTFLEHAADNYSSNPKLLTDIMQTLNSIEQKSTALINSVRSVTQLLGQAINIDVDKASLSTMLIRLPSLIRESVTKLSNDPQLADRISSSLDSKLSELSQSLRFNPQTLQQSQGEQEVQGITFEEYSSLHDSVPNQPTHQPVQGQLNER